MPLNTHISVRRRKLSSIAFGFSLALLALLAFAPLSAAETLQPSASGGSAFLATPATTPGLRARLASDGRTALVPEKAPRAVKLAIAAANQIVNKPYIWGGGHATYKKIARGYDCSGTVSWALGRAGLMRTGPLDSGSFMSWGKSGRGNWITVYTNPGHAYVYIAGLRLDTSGPGERGPRWRKDQRSNSGFRARYIPGL